MQQLGKINFLLFGKLVQIPRDGESLFDRAVSHLRTYTEHIHISNKLLRINSFPSSFLPPKVL